MSTALAKKSLALAVNDAQAFRALFPFTAYKEWTIAGSVRRGEKFVGDVEHVVVPTITTSAGLFPGAAVEQVNELWAALDNMVQMGTVRKAQYGQTLSTRWGEKYRGVVFRGIKHEIFTADNDNFGAILAIRTGPAPFSTRLVSELRTRGLRQQDGYVTDAAGQRISAPDEMRYFWLCGVNYLPPEKRS